MERESMMTGCLPTTSLERGELEVIRDIRGPEKISISSLEIVPLVKWRIPPSMTWEEFFDKDWDRYDAKYCDIRDRAKEMDSCFGLQHAQCLLRARKETPGEWRNYFLLFPGTTLRSAKDQDLYLPVIWGGTGKLLLYFLPIFSHTWDLRKTRFVRWRK